MAQACWVTPSCLQYSTSELDHIELFTMWHKCVGSHNAVHNMALACWITSSCLQYGTSVLGRIELFTIWH